MLACGWGPGARAGALPGVAPDEVTGVSDLGAPVTHLVLDPPLAAPQGPLSDDDRAHIARVLNAQAAALEVVDEVAYLATFAPDALLAGESLGGEPAPSGTGVAGRPAVRVRELLFGEIEDGALVDFAGVTPLFMAPGPGRTADVAARHVAAYQRPGGERRFLDLTVIERLRPVGEGGSNWQVYDWFVVVDEETARRVWLAWVDGKVELEPFDATLRGDLVYTLYPGFSPGGSEVAFELGETFRVTSVRGETGDLPWEFSGGRLTIGLTDPEQVSTLVISYEGHVTPTGSPRRGNLEYLGPEGIYLRPASGWYPRPVGGGPVRGSLEVVVPAWWAVAASGRMVGCTPAGGIGELRTFEWALDPPAEIYLAAGPYLVRDRVTAQGITIRTFFYGREDTWAEAYLEETERILDVFTGLFGPYPYPSLTLAEVQDFYYGGLSARSLLFLEKEWLANPRTNLSASSLLAHEVSHQWWGEIVPVLSDHPEWFLWEGLASYSEALYAEAAGGPAEALIVMADKAAEYAEAARGHRETSIKEANVRWYDWQNTFVYEKGAWLFHTLRFLLGDDEFFDLLRVYLDRFTGREPTTRDLAALVAASSGGDPYLERFMETWVDEPGDVDLALSRVSMRPAGDESGVYVLDFYLRDAGSRFFPRAEVTVGISGQTSKVVVAEAGANSLRLPGPVTRVEVDAGRKVLDLTRDNNRWYFVGGLSVPGTAFRYGAELVLGVVLSLLAVRLAGAFGHDRPGRRGPVVRGPSLPSGTQPNTWATIRARQGGPG